MLGVCVPAASTHLVPLERLLSDHRAARLRVTQWAAAPHPVLSGPHPPGSRSAALSLWGFVTVTKVLTAVCSHFGGPVPGKGSSARLSPSPGVWSEPAGDPGLGGGPPGPATSFSRMCPWPCRAPNASLTGEMEPPCLELPQVTGPPGQGSGAAPLPHPQNPTRPPPHPPLYTQAVPMHVHHALTSLDMRVCA